MSEMVNVNIKMDSDVKKNMEQVCAELGLSMSAAFTIFPAAAACSQRPIYRRS